ncbi:ibp1 [Candida oxycetoniae]|uniref:Ibp1 n=1 Tax=Candida oxycetoniae TaxID=497107 RepID=A0AAI9SV44_9ASCO|nr:ibp1 [Candida oxycetoniae]KAI3403394.1 ibp1 [Candida oxycetoniae]
MNRKHSITDVKTIKPAELYPWVRNNNSPHGKFVVVDVRDADYAGGHIRNSWNHTIVKFHLKNASELHERLYCERVKAVVFHCSLSQSRGPRAALLFLRSLDHIKDKQLKDYFENDVHIYLLIGGFAKWQELYGNDPDVTEDYDPEIWRQTMSI